MTQEHALLLKNKIKISAKKVKNGRINSPPEILSFVYPGFISMLSGTYVSSGAISDAVYVMLTIAAYVLYLFGGGVITFGGILVIIHFIQVKLKDPYQPSSSTRYL